MPLGGARLSITRVIVGSGVRVEKGPREVRGAERLSSQSVLTDCMCPLRQWPLLANLKVGIL